MLAESAAQPGFVRAATRFVAELGRSMVDPARFTRALRDWAGDGPRRAYAEEVAAALPRLPRRARPRRRRRRRRVRLARARRPAGRSRRMGRHAPVRLRVRRLHRARARCARDDLGPLRRRRERVAAVRARPRGLPGHGRHQAGAARARRLGAGARAGRRALRGGLARRPPPPRTAPVRGARRAGRPGRRDLVPQRRRRARRGRARRRAHPRAAARGRRARRRGRGVPAAELVRVAARAGVRRLRDSLLDRPSRPVRPHRHRARPAGADPLRLARRQRRRPAHLPAHPRKAARDRPGRPARGRCPQGGRPQRRAGPRAVGGEELRAGRARPARPGA